VRLHGYEGELVATCELTGCR